MPSDSRFTPAGRWRASLSFCWLTLALAATPLVAEVRISEFLAVNKGGLTDGYRDTPDWIEIENPGSTAVNLGGWHLTDDPHDLAKWTFPPTSLGAGQFLVVFASGRGTPDPGGKLHTNFQLDSDGEYLALVKPDGTTVASEFAAPFRPQLANVSYGVRGAAGFVQVLRDDAPLHAFVPVDDSLGAAWIQPGFDDSGWQAGRNPVGYEDTPAEYAALIQTDMRATMRGKNTSCFIRYVFNVDDPAAFANWRLTAQYDDGFVAWLNGERVVTQNAPASPAWNATALANHPDSEAIVPVSFDLPPGAVHAGENVLAVQGLNVGLTSSDFLVRATIEAQPKTVAQATLAYFTKPTPGQPNVGGVESLGPLLDDVKHTPSVPAATDDLVVTALVSKAFAPVASATLHFVVQFGTESTLPMLDDGAHGDSAANDGVFGAVIPAGVAAPGQMIRYFVTAVDSNDDTSRAPLYLNPVDSDQYYGTVVADPSVTSQLPLGQLFVSPANLPKIDGESGGRVALFFDGEFYDNVYMEVRGNTTAGCNKKSHRLEFNHDHPLKHPGPGGRIRKTSFMADYADPSYLRQHLSMWLMDQAGLEAPFYYPIRLQMNGQFYQLAFHSDVLGEEQLKRFGLDPDGALYKACGVVEPGGSSTGGFQKKTREWEGTQDYVAFANAVHNGVPNDRRRTNLFDMVDLPRVINYMAVARITHEEDDIWANMSLYRDSDGDHQWRIIPFDLNLSWGQIYGSGTVQATVDTFKSHPLYGSAKCIQAGGPFGAFNHFYDAIIQVPETRQMLLRRIRSIMDRFVQPPGTPASEGILEQHIKTMTNSFWTEAFLDRKKWGWPVGCGPYGFGANLWLTNGVTALENQFIVPRRRHLFATHSVTNTAKVIGLANANNAGIPLPQPADAVITIGELDFNPASHNQDEEFIQLVNTNNFAVDLSGWNLSGGISFRFAAGTVMPSNSVMYLSPNLAAFRARSVPPRGTQGLFVHGPYKGHLSARGETLRLSDDAGREVSTLTYVGNPSLAQQWLRITEIHYHPAPLAGSGFWEDEFEFIELKNTGPTSLDLNGVRFTAGINFDFTGSAVTQLAAGEVALVVRNAAAFAARYGTGFRIAGEYALYLDNSGERLQLLDAVNEEIADFSYDAAWLPLTDGQGFSLELIAPSRPPGERTSWRASLALGGSPGVVPAAGPVIREAKLRADGLQLTFDAEAGIAYRIEWRMTATSGVWTPVATIPAAGAGGPATATVPVSGDATGFYRVAVP